MNARKQQLAALVNEKVAAMTDFQRNYMQRQFGRSEVSALWVQRKLTTEEFRNFEKQMDAVDAFVEMVRKADAASDNTVVKNHKAPDFRTNKEREFAQHRQQYYDQQQQQQFADQQRQFAEQAQRAHFSF